jgi:hypothetical protein
MMMRMRTSTMHTRTPYEDLNYAVIFKSWMNVWSARWMDDKRIRNNPSLSKIDG